MLIKDRITPMLLTTVAVTLGTVSQASAAPSEQTLGQCVSDLNAPYYNISNERRDQHIDACVQTLSNQAPSQTLAQCVSDLNAPYYNISNERQNKHISACTDLIRLQQMSVRPVQSNPVFYPNNQNVSGGSPQAIAACMDSLLYAKNQVCIDPWGSVDKDCFFKNSSSSSTRIVRTRTEVSESAAAQACQNAR